MLTLDPSSLSDVETKVSEFITPTKQWDMNKLRQIVPTDIIHLI